MMVGMLVFVIVIVWVFISAIITTYFMFHDTEYGGIWKAKWLFLSAIFVGSSIGIILAFIVSFADWSFLTDWWYSEV